LENPVISHVLALLTAQKPLQESKCRNDTDEMGFCTENARLRRLILTRTDVAAQFLPNFTFSRGWAEIAMDEPYAPGERAHRLCVLIAGNGPIRRLSNCCSKADRAENGESSESERRRRAPLRAGEVRSEDDRTSHIYFQVAVGDPGDSLSGSVRACATTSSWRTASSEAAAERSSRWSAR
jgi:hypothetical protein